MSASFRLLARYEAIIKRLPKIINGKRGEARLIAQGIFCTPLDPISEEIKERMGLPRSEAMLLQTYLDGEIDVRAGDTLTVNGRDYPVKAAASYNFAGSITTHLIVERIIE